MNTDQNIAETKRSILHRGKQALAREIRLFLQTVRERLNNNPKLKRIIMPIVLRIPLLNQHVHTFVQSENRHVFVQSEDSPASCVHLTERALEIYEDIHQAIRVKLS